MKYIVIILAAFACACSPMSYVTTTPAVMLGVYDEFGKRETWRARAIKGDIHSQYELGESLCCNRSEGETNIIESAKWFCKAAQGGSPQAMISLAQIFEGRKGQGIKVDEVKALGLYSMADWRANLEGSVERKRIEKTLNAEEIANAKNFAYYFDFHDCGKILTE